MLDMIFPKCGATKSECSDARDAKSFTHSFLVALF
jgi:hypothetical protein